MNIFKIVVCVWFVILLSLILKNHKDEIVSLQHRIEVLEQASVK